ncbi:MAG: Re/Si-specific NAD(P)(+) transhydrogenase subunit alpha [Candidatus Latescibacteria bacterium]|nr:Re/Si-specific NAD(P)(+) transhydrogenase subunit alpha [Candidatus Latescibacterota bacterium]MDP7449143.1 Re/Si-specific NAD(P)(+) transhydrogenase subunit alpha [Candidatus Latescibacterota bacterium]HJP33244.1 Re/Si-specific NAD(P)(+) transhydrogenase subunit alpha [Candidatus Latescibacterota bacterium]
MADEMIAGVPAESYPGERRVALVPDVAHALTTKGIRILLQAGAGDPAGYPDAAYADRGAEVVADRQQLFAAADVVLQVRTHGADAAGASDLPLMRAGQTVIGFADALDGGAPLQALAATGVSLYAMELMPRITRAQSMDALSSMATIAGYKAVLLAASELPRIFPLMMTAAGTLAPARALVIGAGVAGLQAIASARRLGARVSAYDVRPAVKEQVQSLGADFVELDLASDDSEDAGGYARAADEAFYQKQREELGKVVAESDVVITTAAIPGQPAPKLITADAVRAMPPGSVIVDLAAERGGNCELTRPDETIVDTGTTILGPTNLPATVPAHASQMYAHNISTFVQHLRDEESGQLQMNMEDEITAGTLVARDGAIVHPRLLEGSD